jgi:hypothetical protein
MHQDFFRIKLDGGGLTFRAEDVSIAGKPLGSYFDITPDGAGLDAWTREERNLQQCGLANMQRSPSSNKPPLRARRVRLFPYSFLKC